MLSLHLVFLAKPTSEFTLMNTRYNEYVKNTHETLINIANNWIFEKRDIGYPLLGLNGQIMDSAHKKIKKKSEIQIQVSDVSFEERGFPLTLITCYSCLKYTKAIVNMFLGSKVIQDALHEEEELNILSCPVNFKEYTVLLPKTFPSLHHEDPLEWRYLIEPPIKRCECNLLTDLNILDDSNQDNVLNILTKWHCTCGKKVRNVITANQIFVINEINNSLFRELYQTNFPFSTNRSRRRKHLQVKYRRLRCKYSFNPQQEGNYTIKRFVEVHGWPDSKVAINVSGVCDLPRIYEEHYTIELRNSSLITADVTIEFLEDSVVFQIDKTFIRLEPGCRGTLMISAAPAEVGIFTSVLLFCVKDNPEIISIKISCNGVVPNVQILPLTKTIEYGRHLLYRREGDRFIIKNDSILPIMWKVRNATDFIQDFIISDTSGIIERYENQVVPVTYIACRVGVIHQKPLTIDVSIYDAEGRGNPMIEDVLLLSAECYDVLVECAYANMTENFLNYGNVKVNSTVYQEMYLLNRGKYNIFYKFVELKKVKKFPEPALLKSFEAVPEFGVIPPTLKLVTIEFECTPTTSMNLVNVPAYICSLLDGSKNQVVVAKFPVCVTIASFYNTFTLFPLGELNFHIIPVGSGVMREVILNNTSKCPVTYEIVVPEEYRPEPAADLQPAKAKLKDNKSFFATAAKTFEETIKFIISDTCPAEASGVPLKLVGTGAVPTIDFWNIETTFREHLIVKDLADYTAAIDLYNCGLVACALTLKLHYQANSNPEIFSLDKYETHIEPLLHKNLGIIFSPKELLEYRAVLEVKLKLFDNQEKSFKICLIGEGVIPRIRLISPQLRYRRIASLKFPVTCLGSVSTRNIRFKNVSSLKTEVSVGVEAAIIGERLIFWIAAA
ncbi:unnamed protein product, partial [Leptidea sinapis]